MNIEKEIQISVKLESYIKNGFVNVDSFENPDDEAADCFLELFQKKPELCEKYCKIILNDGNVGDKYLESSCLSHLFDLNKECSLLYVEKEVGGMSPPVLAAAMDGLCQYSNTPFRNEYSNNLINKISDRYDEIVQEDVYRGALDNSYKLFFDIFLRK
ncbi:hypothetical protein ACMGEE_21615 [Erwinia sp. DT-104]|uniref:hypothetical protein n=1 Tax=Erwinia sp. DT-104 TaxID=3396161 RepID=UPI003F1DDEFA